MTTRILVTGANGFLGRALCTTLLVKGFRVIAMVRRAEVTLAPGVTPWIAPALPELAEDATRVLADVDVVIHTAGRAHMLQDQAANPLAEFRRVNTEGTLALARAAAAAGVKRFIFVSSIGVNGSESGSRPMRADDPVRPDSPYAQSKWEAEQALLELARQTGMTTLLLRPPMIYGPDAPGNFALLARLVAKGWPLPLGALDAPRSFVSVDNVVDLLIHMVNFPDPVSGVYLVADAQITTTTQFIQAIARGMGRKIPLIPVNSTLLQMLGTMAGRGDQIRKMSVPLAVDIRSTTDRLGWTPPISMDQAMQRAFSASRTSPTSLESNS